MQIQTDSCRMAHIAVQWQFGTDGWQEDARAQFYLYSKQIPSASGAI